MSQGYLRADEHLCYRQVVTRGNGNVWQTKQRLEWKKSGPFCKPDKLQLSQAGDSLVFWELGDPSDIVTPVTPAKPVKGFSQDILLQIGS